MIHCKELDQDFSTQEELFKALKENKDKIISIKKKTIYTGYDVNSPENSKQVVSNSQVKLKAIEQSASKDLFKDTDYYYFAVNTTNVLDSHNDLHVKGIWNRSAKLQNRKNYLVDTHSLTIKDTIAYPEDVEIFVTEIPFKALGKNYEGDTEALIYKVHKDNIIGDTIKDAIDKGKTMQASVKMQYVQMEIAMKSEAKEDEDEFATYNKYKGQIANIGDFKKEPLYFFVQKEAKNIHESSLVPFGSNSATGQIKNDSLNSTHKDKETVKTYTSANSFLI